jgi:Co/Zn/Cd efflux system component
MSGCDCEIETKEQSRVLIMLLSINALMFVVEVILGIVAESTALIADSLDMLADATVYGIGLYAVGKPVLSKVRAAHTSGILQIILGSAVAMDVIRRFIYGSEPEPLIMLVVGAAALVANLLCMKLIFRHRHGEVHMRASWIFSKNDVIANVGILLAAGLVYALDSSYPDMVIGLMIAVIVIRGGIQIVRDAGNEKQAEQNKCG